MNHMKKTLLIAALALVCGAASAQNFKFAHVNLTELVQLMPEMDKAREQSDAAAKEAQETYQSMMEEFQAKYQAYEQKQASWTPAIRESKEKELSDINTRIQEFQQSIQQELQQLQNDLMAPIYQKANEEIDKLAKAEGVIYVFDVQAVLFIDEAQSIDLTPKARIALGIPEGRTLEALQKELMEKAQAQQQQ